MKRSTENNPNTYQKQQVNDNFLSPQINFKQAPTPIDMRRHSILSQDSPFLELLKDQTPKGYSILNSPRTPLTGPFNSKNKISGISKIGQL